MDFKRISSALIGLPLVLIVFIFGNKYVVDVSIAIISAICLHEYFNSIKGKYNPVVWVGYLVSILIAFVHVIPQDVVLYVLAAFLPSVIVILFLHILLSQMKTNLTDVSVTTFGICYIAFFLLFLPIIHGLPNGKIWVGLLLIIAWGTDIFAYTAGKVIGKHKFSKISPNKTIEGCIGGVVGAVVLALIYALIINNTTDLSLNYVIIGSVAVILSIISQIGDFAASSIKRYVGIKDFSNLIPGHGGMLDRIDSVIFIAPFAYILIKIIM